MYRLFSYYEIDIISLLTLTQRHSLYCPYERRFGHENS